MKKSKPLRNIVILLLITIVAYTFIGKITGFSDVGLVFKHMNKGFLALALLATALTYTVTGLKWGNLLNAQGYKFKFRDLVKFGMVGSFAIHFLPIGNFGESALNFYLLKQHKVKTSSALTLFVIRLIFDYFAFFSLFTISLAFIPTHPSLSLKIQIAFLIMLAALIFGFLYLNYILRKPKKFIKQLIPVLRYLKKTFHFIQNFETSNDPKYYYAQLAEEIRLNALKNLKFSFAIKLYFYCLLFWFTDILVLYFALIGFGVKLNIFAIIFAYVIGITAGIISFLPAGIGVVEGSLIFVLNAFSTNLPAIGLGVLTYRLISLWLAIPLGLVAFYRLKGTKKLFK